MSLDLGAQPREHGSDPTDLPPTYRRGPSGWVTDREVWISIRTLVSLFTSQLSWWCMPVEAGLASRPRIADVEGSCDPTTHRSRESLFVTSDLRPHTHIDSGMAGYAVVEWSRRNGSDKSMRAWTKKGGPWVGQR